MDLAGKLSTIGLAEVFQNIAFNNHSGTLTLKEGEKKAQVAFEAGKVRAAKVAGQDLDYLDIARRCELAPEEILAKAESTNRKRTLKAYLLANGALDEAQYDATIAAYVEEEILPLFAWRAASFSFEEGKLKERVFDREQLGCDIALDPTGVAMEAARRLDEWETIHEYVPTDKEVLVHAGVRDVELPAGAERLLPLLDGTRNLEQVAKESPLKKFDVFKCVATLVQMGVLMPATAERVRELAVAARTAGKVTLAARRLEVALELDPEDLETRVELVRLYERAGRKYDAAREQCKLAEAQAERGDMEGALDSYERASVLAPDDLDILERILGLHEGRGDIPRAEKVGRRLAEALAAQGMYEDALPLYERLLKSNDGNMALRESLANCLVKLEQGKDAARHLLAIADAACERRDFATARRYYRRILTLDDKHKAAKEKLQEIESGEVEARLRRRRRWRRRVLLVVAAALLAVQLGREWLAQSALQKAHVTTVTGLSKHNDERARVVALQRYLEIARRNAWTLGGHEAAATAGELLTAEVVRMDLWVQQAIEARTTIEVEASIGLAQKQLRRLDGLTWPDDLAPLWQSHRDRLTSRIANLLER